MSGGLLGVDISMALSDVLNKFRDGCGGSLAQYGQFTHQCSCSMIEFEAAPRDQS